MKNSHWSALLPKTKHMGSLTCLLGKIKSKKNLYVNLQKTMKRVKSEKNVQDLDLSQWGSRLKKSVCAVFVLIFRLNMQEAVVYLFTG
jgi:hypothetical protein